MKRFYFILSSILVLFLSTAFIQTQEQEDPAIDPATYKLMEVTFLWDLLKSGYEPDKKRDGTWLDVGFRSKYAMAKEYATLELVETAFGCPVFLRGPHDGDVDFNSTTSFGYYNPVFISKLRLSVESALKNPLFKKVAQGVYRKDLESMARTYRDTYLYMNKEKKEEVEALKTKYLAMIAGPHGTTEGSLQEEFRYYDSTNSYAKDAAELKDRKASINEYEAFTAPAFWLRRSIDGTGPQLFELVDMVIKEMAKE